MERFFALTTEDKQAALDDAWDSARALEIGLLPQLRANERAARTPALAAGVVIQSSSSNGHMGTAFAPGAGAPSPIEFARAWRELINLFIRASLWIQNPSFTDGTVPAAFCYRDRLTLAAVSVALPNAAPTDAQVDGLMRNWLVPITEARSDYGALRIDAGVQSI